MAHWPTPLPLLVGAGPTHLRWVADLARRAAAGRSGPAGDWVVPQARAVYLPALWGWMANPGDPAALALDLPSLADRAGLRLHVGAVQTVDGPGHQLVMVGGEVLRATAFSLDLLPVMPRATVEQAISGARTHGLFAWPLEGFVTIWSRMRDWLSERARHLVVVGASRHAQQLARAAQAALVRHAGGRVSLVLDGPAPQEPPASARLQALHAQGITVLPDTCVGLAAGVVQLGCGAQLVCDAAVLATRAEIPLEIGTGMDMPEVQIVANGDAQAWPAIGPEPMPLPWTERLAKPLFTGPPDRWQERLRAPLEQRAARHLARLAMGAHGGLPAHARGAHANPR